MSSVYVYICTHYTSFFSYYEAFCEDRVRINSIIRYAFKVYTFLIRTRNNSCIYVWQIRNNEFQNHAYEIAIWQICQHQYVDNFFMYRTIIAYQIAQTYKTLF